jgi:trehalose 6-phosphate synthase
MEQLPAAWSPWSPVVIPVSEPPARAQTASSNAGRAIDRAIGGDSGGVERTLARVEHKLVDALARFGGRAFDGFDRLFAPSAAAADFAHDTSIGAFALDSSGRATRFDLPSRIEASAARPLLPRQPAVNREPVVAESGGRMGPRIVIVSNRVAVPEAKRAPVAGGLAVAVKAALKNRTGLWFGWSGKVDDAQANQPRTTEINNTTYVLIDLADNDFQEFYNGLANRVLWPILHYRVDLQEYSRADASGYMRVNRIFADKLSAYLREDDIIWVHDYHLMPLARELRARGHANAIGFFLHIPCAPPDILQTLPFHKDILGSLTDCDLVGFHTENDRENFAHYLTMQGAKAGRNDTYEVNGRQVRLGVFPVGIETGVYARLARRASRSPLSIQVKQSLGECRLVLGVDRLDYSKGIPQRLKAFERFLEANPEWRTKVTFLQITPKSRSEIKEYVEIEAEVTTLIGRINGRFGDATWTPIRYVNRSYSRTALAGIYRAADVVMATPLRDGMNLVAKEFLAAQDPDDPGVLILSQFAGAAPSLDRALIVNPHESEGVAAALKRALEMPLAERRERHAPMLDYLMKHDIKQWADSYLSALMDTRSRSGLLDGLRALFAPSPESRSDASR